MDQEMTGAAMPPAVADTVTVRPDVAAKVGCFTLLT
jgi:hypothetical protein